MQARALRSLALILSACVLTACSVGKVQPLDPVSGTLPAKAKADIRTQVALDLDQRRKLVVISDAEHGFFKRQIEQFAYFDEVIPRSELEVRIIRAQLGDEVPTIADRIGLNNAARRYRPFLWIHLERTRKDNTPFAQLVMTDATTMEDLFVAETELDFAWKGVNDQYNWYPLMNALVDYIESNSNTWRRPAGATPAK